MGNRHLAAGLATLGLLCGSALAQTTTQPAIDVGPIMPAPVLQAPPSLPIQTTPFVPVPPPTGVVFPPAGPIVSSQRPFVPVMPVTTIIPAPAGVRATTFADQAPAPVAPPMTIPPMPGTPVTVTPVPTTLMPGAVLSPPVATGEALPTPAPATQVDTTDYTPKLKFKPGDNNLLQIESANGLFKFFVGGRLQLDAVWFRANDDVQTARTTGGVGPIGDGVNIRRGRIDFGGTFYKSVDFLMEWDLINTFNAERAGNPLAANTPAPTDMWVTFKDVPYIGNFRIGNQKPPISFEHMTSSRFLNFMERSLGFDAFIENQNNGFEPGICAFDTYMDERGTWALGVFKNTRSIFGWNVGDGEYDVTGRVTFLPIYENDGENLIHLGFGASHRDFDDDFDRIRARTLLRNGPAILHNIVAEVQVLGSSRDQVNPEFVVVWGPWTFQSEYQRVWLHDATTPVTAGGTHTNHGTAQMQAAYAEVLYFLTGEHQYYNRKTAAFGRVTPRDPFRGFGDSGDTCESPDNCNEHGGIGAWQVGARYSWLDLNNQGIYGGTIQDVTLGLTWYLNPYMKWEWNVEGMHREAPKSKYDGWIYGLGTRIAFDF